MPHRILFTGGGTLGPVTPLLSVVHTWRSLDPSVEVHWVGTPKGPERALVEAAGIPFFALSAPRMNRYRKWTYVLIPFHFVISLIGAVRILRVIRPQLLFSAGAYVSVPLAMVARAMRIPVWIHELDVRPGKANRIMAWCATRITTTWPQTLRAYPAAKTTCIGALVRETLLLGDRRSAYTRYGLRTDFPTILVMGGGTGAAALNDAMLALSEEVLRVANVIHLTGKEKMLPALAALAEQGKAYVALEFLYEGMADVYAAADVVIARAGMGTIAELVALGKPAIIVPIPHSQQEDNAKALQESGAADVIFDLTPQVLLQAILKMVQSESYRAVRAQRMASLFSVQAHEHIVDDALILLEKNMVSQGDEAVLDVAGEHQER